MTNENKRDRENNDDVPGIAFLNTSFGVKYIGAAQIVFAMAFDFSKIIASPSLT